MKRFAVLCGSAPERKIQKKIDSLYESLVCENGGLYAEDEIMIFPNGIDEGTLVGFLNSLRMNGIESVFLYLCTETPVYEYEQSLWLGGNEISKRVIEEPASQAGFVLEQTGSKGDFEVQVVYDSDRDFIDGSEYYLDAELASQMWN